MYRIEKGIPMNTYKGGLKGLTAFLKTMEIEDSFELEEFLRPGLYQLAKQVGITLKTETTTTGMIRAWRVE